MDDSDIAWESDKESMFKNVPQDFDDLKMLGHSDGSETEVDWKDVQW